MTLLCALLLGSPLAWSLPAEEVTLSWTHSIERVEWRETWGVRPSGLSLREARVRGSGAGMEPGEGARLEAGWWVWQPAAEVARLTLARSGTVEDYRLCLGDLCRPLTAWFSGLPESGSLALTPC